MAGFGGLFSRAPPPVLSTALLASAHWGSACRTGCAISRLWWRRRVYQLVCTTPRRLRLTGTRCTNPTQVRNRGTEAAALVTAALAHAAADLGVSQCGVIEELLPDGGAPPRSREIDPRLSRD